MSEKKEPGKKDEVICLVENPVSAIALQNKPLTSENVEKLRERHGLNKIASQKRIPWYVLLLQSFFHPFNILLIGIAVSSYFAEGDYQTVTIVGAMVLISTSIRFYQELKSESAVNSLLSLVTRNVSVIRIDKSSNEAKEFVVPSETLVPGDWIVLRPGVLIPADAVILSSKFLFVSQAALTGEAVPVEKYASDDTEQTNKLLAEEKRELDEERVKRYSNHKPMSKCEKFFRMIFSFKTDTDSHLDQTALVIKEDLTSSDHVFMGCQVITGVGTAIVIRTGPKTLFGRMAEALSKHQPVNPFQRGVKRISWCFFLTMAILIPPVFAIRAFYVTLKQAFIYSLSVAVGLTPEMLPMIVNANLAKGTTEMTNQKSVLKKMDAIINMGAVDILCTDKTGTLTKGEVELATHLNPYGIPSCVPLHISFVNSYFQSVLQNPLDTAIRSYFVGQIQSPGPKRNNELNYDKISIKSERTIEDLDTFIKKFTRVDELPFDFVRRRLSIFLEEDDGFDGNKKKYLVCKGAVEETLEVCTKTISEDARAKFLSTAFPQETNVISLNPGILQKAMSEYEKLASQGQRVLGVAFKQMPKDRKTIAYEDESEMIFVGFVSFVDPPKETTETAITELMRHNIEIKVLTGDALNVCVAVCKKIKLPVRSVVTSEDVDNATNNGTLSEVVEMGTIFAKLTPLQKSLVVHTLKSRNHHVVAFMGDGINDAPALKEADVGISVDNGVDICRESADVILLDKDLNAVVTGVRIGRKTYGNTIKYIAMAVSSNFGNVFSVAVASVWLGFEPMAGLQLLVQNLLYDISQIAIPWDNMDEEFLMEPHKWRMWPIMRFMIFLGPWSSVFDISTFIFLVYYMKVPHDLKAEDDKPTPESVKLFRTTWFTVGLLTQTLIVHMIRTAKFPLIQSRASWSLTLLTLIIMGIGLALPYVPYINDKLDFVKELDIACYYFLAAVLLAYCIVVNIVKYFYVRYFKEWF